MIPYSLEYLQRMQDASDALPSTGDKHKQSSVTMRQSLIVAGYHEVGEGHWVKPFAYQLFTFRETSLSWGNWFFTDNNGALVLYESKVFDKEKVSNLRDFLAYHEHFAKTDLTGRHGPFNVIPAIDL